MILFWPPDSVCPGEVSILEALEKLLAIAGPALSPAAPFLSDASLRLAGAMSGDILDMLAQRNGFMAFESALQVLPADSRDGVIGLNDWNAQELWRGAYGELSDGLFFFAQDVFGGQFCIENDAIVSFDPETGAREFLAQGLDGWIEKILTDYRFPLGYPLARQWQAKHGALPKSKRLVPVKPFVLGGDFAVSNLVAKEAVPAMRDRAAIAIRIKTLPDGAQLTWPISDEKN